MEKNVESKMRVVNEQSMAEGEAEERGLKCSAGVKESHEILAMCLVFSESTTVNDPLSQLDSQDDEENNKDDAENKNNTTRQHCEGL